MSHYVLPSPDQVTDLFEMLVGRSVSAKKGKPQFIRPTAKLTVASFKRHDTDELAGACIFDVALAVYASAALSMIPASAVSGSIATGKIQENIAENLAEVFNVACQLLQTQDGDFARLDQHFNHAKDVPADLVAKIKGTKKTAHVGVEIQGYGSGLASFYLF